jgi:hypothetical protein
MDQRLRQRLATVSPATTQVANNAKERYMLVPRDSIVLLALLAVQAAIIHGSVMDRALYQTCVQYSLMIVCTADVTWTWPLRSSDSCALCIPYMTRPDENSQRVNNATRLHIGPDACLRDPSPSPILS